MYSAVAFKILGSKISVGVSRLDEDAVKSTEKRNVNLSGELEVPTSIEGVAYVYNKDGTYSTVEDKLNSENLATKVVAPNHKVSLNLPEASFKTLQEVKIHSNGAVDLYYKMDAWSYGKILGLSFEGWSTNQAGLLKATV